MKPSIGRAFLGGFAGTVLLTLMMRFVAPLMTGERMDMASTIGDMTGAGPAVGMIIHFLNGSVIFALIYVFVLYRILPGAPWTRGLLFGLTLWLVLEIVLMPMMRGGIFSSKMGGMKMAMAALVGHLVYGVTLGGVGGIPARKPVQGIVKRKGQAV